MLRSTFITSCVLLAASAAFAQSDRGTITGTISDQTGAVVAGAPIEVKNVETGALFQAASSATGNYTLAQLPVGTYELTVGVPGFARELKECFVGSRIPEKVRQARGQREIGELAGLFNHAKKVR